MTTQYADEQVSKKRFLAPLVVLMLCAVALTGAAYAYSTSITGHGDVNYDYYSIDLYSDTAPETVIKENLTPDIDFDVGTDKTTPGYYTATVTGDGTDGSTIVTYKAYVKVQSKETESIQLTGAGTYTSKDGTAAMYSSWINDVKVVVEFFDGVNSPASFKTNTVYGVTITVTLPKISAVSLETSAPGDVPAKTNFVGTGCISVTLTATAAPSP